MPQQNLSNGNIYSSEFADISDWENGDNLGGVSSQVTFDEKSCMKLDSGTAGISHYARRSQDIGAFGNRTIFSMKLYCDAIGTRGDTDSASFLAYNGSTGLLVSFASDGLFIYDGASYVEIGTNLVVQDTWQEWTFDMDWVAQTVDVYLDQVLQASNVDCSYASTITEGTIRFNQLGYTTDARITYIDWFKAGNDFLFTCNPLRLLWMAIMAIKAAISWLEFDYMEYANDAAAQAAYVSSDTGTTATVTSNNTTADSGDGFGWNVVSAPYKLSQGFKVSSAANISKFTVRLKYITAISGTLTGYIYDDNAGVPNAAVATFSNFAANTLTTSYADYDLTGSFTPTAGVQYHLVLAWTLGTTGDILIMAHNTSSVYADGQFCMYDTVNGWVSYSTRDGYFKVYQDLTNLQSYSESTIKSQGSYSLKGVALATASLNDTLTKTFSTINLSGKSYIRYDIYSSRTGSNISLNIHDSGGVTTSVIAVVTTSTTWETKTWDISGVSDANKDAIVQLYPKIINADADNTFYIDNVEYG